MMSYSINLTKAFTAEPTAEFTSELTLDQASPGIPLQITALAADDNLKKRFQSLGFWIGETIEITTKSHFKKAPLVVKVGSTRFALRQIEAQMINVQISVHRQAT